MSKYYTYNGRFYSEEELTHFKYISKEKKNGKWVYYYYHKTGDKTASTYTSDTMSKDGYGTFKRSGGTSGLPDEEIRRRKSNDLFSSKSTITITSLGKSKKITTENVGRLEQSLNRLREKSKKPISKAKNWLKKLFS